MASSNWDRTVHAGIPGGGEIARYDRAGKWFLEWPPSTGRKRKRLTLAEAAGIAELYADGRGGFVRLSAYGGQRFSHAYLQHSAALAKTPDKDAVRAVYRQIVEQTP